MKHILGSLSLIFFLALSLVSCGGSSSSGGSSGVTGPATITSENQEDLARAAALAAGEVKNGDDAPGAFGAAMSVSSEMTQANEWVLQSLELLNTPTAADASDICSSGSASFESNNSATTVTYNNCNIGGIIATGSATIVTSGETITITYSNFRMVIDGEETVLNATITCVNLDCTISSEFTDSTGKTYRVNNSSISGNDSSGYTISATVYDSEYGDISFTASAIKFDCSNGFPSSGSISISDGTTTAGVTFDSCTSYTITIDGVAESYSW
jgi:hypothetical protein